MRVFRITVNPIDEFTVRFPLAGYQELTTLNKVYFNVRLYLLCLNSCNILIGFEQVF